MKQTLLFTFIGLFFSTASFAQPSYTSSNYADIGDTYLYSTANLGVQLLPFDSTGANVNWDFGSLPIATQSPVDYLDPDNGGYYLGYITGCILSGNFPWTCQANWDNLTNLAVEGQDSIGLAGFQFSDVVTHLHKSSQDLQETMLGVSVGTGQLALPVLIEYDNPDTIYQFPLQYPQVDSSYKAYELDLTQAGLGLTYLNRQQRINEIEGWGSLITPFDTFASVLKMRTDLYISDSTIVNGDTFSIGTRHTVIYRWFDPAFGQPVLEAEGQVLAGLELITAVRFLDTLRCLDPNPGFVTSPLLPLVDPTTGTVDITFNNSSSNADTYLWNFGDGGTSMQMSPTHTFNGGGLFLVELIACNSICSPLRCDTITRPVVVIDTSGSVNAGFFITPVFGRCPGETITFNNISSNANAYLWYFGDGDSSTLQSPTHIYAQGGPYQVTLIASDGNQSDTTVQTINVSGIPDPALGPDTSITNRDTLVLMPQGGTAFAWSDGSSQIDLTFDGTQYAAGSYDFWVEVTNQRGCIGRDTITITVTYATDLAASFASHFRLYPNPGRTFLTILPQGMSDYTVRLSDIQGRIWKEATGQGKTELSTADLPTGLFLLEITTEKQTFQTKWMKQ